MIEKMVLIKIPNELIKFAIPLKDFYEQTETEEGRLSFLEKLKLPAETEEEQHGQG